jgi:hypothetical protein
MAWGGETGLGFSDGLRAMRIRVAGARGRRELWASDDTDRHRRSGAVLMCVGCWPIAGGPHAG